jgi:LmbE family N-acetylglucosaminyl deacetylase
VIIPKRVLVLSPHTDDAELGCGGTMARWIGEGAELFTAAFSTAERSLPPGSKEYRLKDECHLALDEIGVPRANRFIFDYPVRELGYHRQDVLEQMVRLNRELEPEVILAPSGTDLHQDHAVVHNESVRVFRHLTIMGYELPWNHITFPTQAFVVLNEEHIRRKWAALTKYESQLELAQVKTEFAEAYEMIRIRL